jgi:hypothetical protein
MEGWRWRSNLYNVPLPTPEGPLITMGWVVSGTGAGLVGKFESFGAKGKGQVG